MYQVVLVEPKIPQNTGSIARLCAATGTQLHLIEPLGFEITESRVKRAGLDYWKFVDLSTHRSLEELTIDSCSSRFCFFSKKARKTYVDAGFQGDEMLVFGSETDGLEDGLLARYEKDCFRIPIFEPGVRSLNLANAVSIVLYEALRQSGRLTSRKTSSG